MKTKEANGPKEKAERLASLGLGACAKAPRATKGVKIVPQPLYICQRHSDLQLYQAVSHTSKIAQLCWKQAVQGRGGHACFSQEAVGGVQ